MRESANLLTPMTTAHLSLIGLFASSDTNFSSPGLAFTAVAKHRISRKLTIIWRGINIFNWSGVPFHAFHSCYIVPLGRLKQPLVKVNHIWFDCQEIACETLDHQVHFRFD